MRISGHSCRYLLATYVCKEVNLRSTLKPLHLGSLRSEDFAELMLLQNEAASLEWLWRKRASAPGAAAGGGGTIPGGDTE